MSDDKKTAEADASKDVSNKASATDEAKALEKKDDAPSKSSDEDVTVTRAYLKELREEAKGNRKKAEKILTDSKAKESELLDRVESLEKKDAETRETSKKDRARSDKRLIEAEIKNLSSQYGLKKKDYLKLADREGLKVDEDGDVTGVSEMLENLKKSEPDFFEIPSTGIIQERPKSGIIKKPKAAIDSMSPKEKRKYLSEWRHNHR